jgi:hypothetical protein
LESPLVGERLILIAVVLDLAGAGCEPAVAVLVETVQAVDSLLAGPFLAGQGVELGERGLGREKPRVDLLVRVGAAVAYAQAAG